MGASYGNQQKLATLLVGPGLGFQPKTPGGPTAYKWAFELKVSEQKMGYKKNTNDSEIFMDTNNLILIVIIWLRW